MLPSVPDKLNKLFIFIGLGLLVYSWHVYMQETKSYEDKIMAYNLEVKKVQLQLKSLDEGHTMLLKELEIVKSIPTIDSLYKKSANINRKMDSVNQNLIKTKDLKNQLTLKRYEVDFAESQFEAITDTIIPLALLGFITLFGGIIGWSRSEDYETEIKKRSHIHLPSFSNECQSCGIEFNSIHKRGTEKNETKNYHFCLNCYELGEFKNPNLSIVEIKEKMHEYLSNKNKSEKYINRYLRKIEKLDRWK